jgi:hypothetical protein
MGERQVKAPIGLVARVISPGDGGLSSGQTAFRICDVASANLYRMPSGAASKKSGRGPSHPHPAIVDSLVSVPVSYPLLPQLNE